MSVLRPMSGTESDIARWDLDTGVRYWMEGCFFCLVMLRMPKAAAALVLGHEARAHWGGEQREY